MKTSPRSALVLAIVFCTAGLGCEQPVAPLAPLAPLPPPPAPAPVLIVADLAGQVIDADTGDPVPGAVVTAAAHLGPGTSAVTDGSGAFRLEPRVREDWQAVTVVVARDGYESTQSWVQRSTSKVVLGMYPTLTLRPGESLQVRVHLSTYFCSFSALDDILGNTRHCRRVAIESAGEPVEVELVPPAGPDNGVELQADAYTPEFKRRVTVTGGGVWIVGSASSPVTLTARRP